MATTAEIMSDFYPFLMILIGILGVALGVDRILKKREEESKILQVLSFFGGLILLALPILMALIIDTDGVYSNYTLLLMFITGLSMNARPFEKMPAAFTLVSLVGIVLFALVLQLREQSELISGIPLQTILIAIGGLILILFLMTFMAEQALDAFLFLLGWGFFVLIFSLLTLIQGVTILVTGNRYGILSFFGLG